MRSKTLFVRSILDSIDASGMGISESPTVTLVRVGDLDEDVRLEPEPNDRQPPYVKMMGKYNGRVRRSGR